MTKVTAEERDPAAGLRALLLWSALLLLVFCCAFIFCNSESYVPALYFRMQDGPVAFLYVAGLLLVRAQWVPSGASLLLPKLADRRAQYVLAGFLMIGAWAGTYWLFQNYPLTRDEQMVVFDAAIFRSGRLAMPVDPAWRAFVPALTPDFLLKFAGNSAWVSAYMPGNAATRSLVGMVLDPALMNPALAGAGLLSLGMIARRLFPADRGAQGIAVLLYISSAQIWVTAMTPFAMTGHLALNLIWLALFLRGGRLGHGAAGAVGIWTVGWHQVIFHPLFVAPFLVELLRARRWGALIWYGLVYAVAGVFWMSYQHLVTLWAGAPPLNGPGAGLQGFIVERALPLLLQHDGNSIYLMAENLLRFFTWQNLALLPLALLGMQAVRAGEGIARPLCLGLILTIAAMWVLLPWQGHGYGYRYLHGLIGNAALLAGYGWIKLAPHARATAGRLVGAGTVLTLCAAPLLAKEARVYEKPYADLSAAVGRLDADFAVIDDYEIPFGADIARNDPALGNRPLRFAATYLDAGLVGTLCKRGSVAFVARGALPGIDRLPVRPDPHQFDMLLGAARGARCRMTVFAGGLSQ
jgi:hypothetical protein